MQYRVIEWVKKGAGTGSWQPAVLQGVLGSCLCTPGDCPHWRCSPTHSHSDGKPLGFGWNTFWDHHIHSHGSFAAESWTFAKQRWESAVSSLPTPLVMLPDFLLLFFFLQYFIEPFSLQVVTMPGSAEPGPAAVGSAETSVIYLPVLTTVPHLCCTKWKGCQVFFTSWSAVPNFCGLAWISGPDLGCTYHKLHISPMYASRTICSLFSIGCMLLTCVFVNAYPLKSTKGFALPRAHPVKSWVALRHAAFGEHCGTSHHRSKQLLWSVQTEISNRDAVIDSPVFTLLQSNLTMTCSIILFHISAIPPQFLPHSILQSLLPSASLLSLKDCPWPSIERKKWIL